MRIAILSRNKKLYSTSRLVQAGSARGHEMLVLDHTKCYMVTESENPQVYLGDHAINELDAIIPRIGASVTFYGSSVVRQYEVQKVFTTCSSLALVRSRDKLRSLQILAKSDVNIPKTAIARDPDDVNAVINSVDGTPLIIKLLEGTQGKGVVLAETRKAAKSVIEAFHGLNANILVQEYISEAKATDIRAFVINGKVVGAMKRLGTEGEFRSNLHKGGMAVPVKLSKLEKETAAKAAKALGLKIAGVDILPSNRGPLVIEVNSSPGLQGIEKATNIDIAGKIISYIEDNIAISHEKQKDKVGV